ncbi:hypothetical protein [Methanobacterium alcaliphilum]|uniref:hypothetical protein n=1 Tax=Methanobacterium alcaliphilum TaxID=392018 RepID=UPI00200AFE36|nr:hypothetical protein [Methanobacterium alcaliphilum]MCK9151192.1 hypothetical protein [Methanobacterium alcaliphilum]
MEKTDPVQGPIFIGRSWEEYLKMFDLKLDKLQDKRILDCAAGASSFTQYMSKKGFDSVAVDILYDKDPLFLYKKCNDHLKALINALKEIQDEFVWNFFKDLNDL